MSSVTIWLSGFCEWNAPKHRVTLLKYNSKCVQINLALLAAAITAAKAGILEPSALGLSPDSAVLLAIKYLTA